MNAWDCGVRLESLTYAEAGRFGHGCKPDSEKPGEPGRAGVWFMLAGGVVSSTDCTKKSWAVIREYAPRKLRRITVYFAGRRLDWRVIMRRMSFAVVLCLSALGLAPAMFAEEQTPQQTPAVSGEELFHREWLPNDPRSHGGDGLGPMFNDTSCVACHNLGRPGGGGPTSKNVQIVTVITDTESKLHEMGLRQVVQNLYAPAAEFAAWKAASRREHNAIVRLHPEFKQTRSVVWHRSSLFPPRVVANDQLTTSDEIDHTADPQPEVAGVNEMVVRTDAFPNGFPLANMRRILVALAPRHGVMPRQGLWYFRALWAADDAIGWLQTVVQRFDDNGEVLSVGSIDRDPSSFAPRQMAESELIQARIRSQVHPVPSIESALIHESRFFSAAVSDRNPPAIFGAGLIDRIPDVVLEAAAAARFADWLKVSGRVSRLSDGRIGRFGWKGQTATLYDFTVTACAVELGLHVPDHPQSIPPMKPDYKPAGFDLTREECQALADFLRNLPAPVKRSPSPAEAAPLAAGEALFAKVGCAACHLPKLGDVDGLYSDFLLHDMGPDLEDSGAYGGSLPDPPAVKLDPAVTAAGKPKRIKPAAQREWRTPPLWGVRDSSPYLHDGRADTIEEAVAMHGGEAEASSLRFFELPHAERLKLVAFLKSLTAP